jgi:hypothetical protein
VERRGNRSLTLMAPAMRRARSRVNETHVPVRRESAWRRGAHAPSRSSGFRSREIRGPAGCEYREIKLDSLFPFCSHSGPAEPRQRRAAEEGAPSRC